MTAKKRRHIVPEPPEVELDEQGWPRGFWEHPPRVDEDFDLGDRSAKEERPDPLGRKPR